MALVISYSDWLH